MSNTTKTKAGERTQKLFRAYIETTHFDFDSYGRTRKEARDALMRAWRQHVKETGADADYISAGDLNVYEIQVGKGYRDREEVRAES